MKKTLLALCVSVLALGASAQTFKKGEAFAYPINPSFSFNLTGEDGEGYVQYPAGALQGQASMQYGFWKASVWFAFTKFDTPAAANEACPIVGDPWNDDEYVLRMQTTRWDGFGNFNFALPEVGELCRVRVIYRVDVDGVENAWYNGNQKPFHVKLMDDADQDTPDYPELTELNEQFWADQQWRVADFYSELGLDCYYLSLLWDAGGLSCQRNVPFYVKEVSVVPCRLLEGDTHEDGDMELATVQDCPELVYVEGMNAESSIDEISASAKAAEGIYDLQGRKVANAAHGLFIINGVKTLVK